jgi:hypothetical protein
MHHGIDFGFELAYGKLSCRGKFIRTLWATPLILLPFCLPPGLIGLPGTELALTLLMIFLAQSGYTYAKWQGDDWRSQVRLDIEPLQGDRSKADAP